MPTIATGAPSKFAHAELAGFEALVLAGGEVRPQGLTGRIAAAVCLSFAREDDCLVGVAALKKPLESYRQRVQDKSGAMIAAASFPYELGWVFIMPSARRQGLSLPLCEPLVAAADGKGIFATSRTDNAGMHKTLERLRFKHDGQEWPSTVNDARLKLFLKPAA